MRLGTGRETLRGMILRARRHGSRVVFPEGTHETILRACGILMDEGIAQPDPAGAARARSARRSSGSASTWAASRSSTRSRSPRLEGYADEYFRLRHRRGVMRAAAAQRLRQRDYFAAMMLHPATPT